MSDVPAVECGTECAGCTAECAACAVMACGHCDGCNHAKEMGRRARAATASMQLLQIGTFGFNPGQKRGPDGRFIKMGGRGSAGKGGLPKGAGRASAKAKPPEKARPAVKVPPDGRGQANLTKPNVELDASDSEFLSDYIEDGRSYREINSALRGQTEMTPEMQAKVEKLDAIMADARLGGDTRLFRALSVRATDPIVGQLKRGNVIADPGYGSATGDINAVDDFYGADDYAIEFQIDAREGQPVLVLGNDLSDRAMMQTDREVLLPRGYRLQVTDVRRHRNPDGQTVLTVKANYEGAPSATESQPTSAAVPDTGPSPSDYGTFKPRSDDEWRMLQTRLKKRTPRLEPDGELQPGDVVPTSDGKWQTIEGGEVRPRHFEGIVVNVKDDSKGYRHTEGIQDIRTQIRKYAEEQAWRDAGGSKDRLEGRATPAPDRPARSRAGTPEIGEDGRYAKPVKQYAVLPDGEVVTRSSRNPYQYVAQYILNNGELGWVSWHKTRANAERGNLTGEQRKGVRVGHVVPVTLDKPAEA